MKIQGDAKVTVSIVDNMPVMQFDVKTFGIPRSPYVGQEVTVNFEAPNIKNKDEFYTDSNNLEM